MKNELIKRSILTRAPDFTTEETEVLEKLNGSSSSRSEERLVIQTCIKKKNNIIA